MTDEDRKWVDEITAEITKEPYDSKIHQITSRLLYLLEAEQVGLGVDTTVERKPQPTEKKVRKKRKDAGKRRRKLFKNVTYADGSRKPPKRPLSVRHRKFVR